MAHRLRLLALLSAFCLAAPATASVSRDSSETKVRIPGHVVPALARAARMSPSVRGRDAAAVASEPLTLTVVLRRDDDDGFARFLADLYDPTSPHFRNFLTPRQISDRFGPSEATYQAVRHYLEQHGFVLTEGSQNRLTLTLRGTRAEAERAFAVTIGDYRLGERSFHANNADPALPPAIAAKVDAIAGLSDLGVPRREPQSVELAFVLCAVALTLLLALCAWFFWTAPIWAAAAGASGGVTAVLGACLLGFTLQDGGSSRAAPDTYINHPYNPPIAWTIPPGAGGAIKNVPRQKIGLVQFDTFHRSDVEDFLALTGFPASRIESLTEVAVNGGVALPGPGEAEVLLDIDAVMNLAPTAEVVVFSAPQATSWQAMFNTMLDQGVTVISNSWTSCENEHSLADVKSIDAILQAAAASGVSVFNAAGDTGSTCLGGSPNTVGVPASSPHATAVGGTSMINATGWVYGSESWWQGKGGFGVSGRFARPAYQDGLVASSMRSVPDVSAFADPSNGMLICQASHGGCPNGLLYGGTSLAAPVWAAYAANLNASRGTNLGALNPLLYPLAGTAAFHSAASLGTDVAHVGLGTPNLDALDRLLAGVALGGPDAAESQVFYSTALTQGFEAPPFLVIPADGQAAATVTVIVRDANRRTVGGRSVVLSANAGSDAVISPPGALISSESNGAAVFTIVDLTPDDVTFSATVDGTPIQQTATITFGVPPAASGGITANPTTVAPDGVSTTTITVTLEDALGRPTPGKTITLAQGAGHSVITAPDPPVTDVNGQINFTATNRVNEVVTFIATDVTDGDLPVPGSAQVTWSGVATSCVGPAPQGQNGFSVTPFATGFVAQSFFLGGVNWGGCPGASIPAFRGDDVFIADFPTGGLYRFGVAGGAVSSANLVNTLGQTLQFPVVGPDGTLYAAFGTSGASGATGSVVELDPATGTIVRTLAPNQKCPAGLAIDPLSGDLFFIGDCFGAGLDDAVIHRIRNPASATPTLEAYATLSSTPTGVLAFAPNGTLYVATAYTSANPPVVRIAGTDTPSPPAQTTVTGVSTIFWLTVASADENGEATALLTLTVDGVNFVDLTTNPPTVTLITTSMGIGPIGPDGCLYGIGSDILYRVTRTDGTCDFRPGVAAPALTLTPGTIVPDPEQGTTQIFTARLLNAVAPAGTRVMIRVSGANPEIKQVQLDPDGTASFSHLGIHTGTDSIVATTTISEGALKSNTARIDWAPGKHVTFLTLDPSATSAMPGTPVTVKAILTDVSASPVAPVTGVSVHFEVAGDSCDGVTDGTGVASCELTPTGAPGSATLSASFAGNAQYASADASSFFVLFSVSAALDHFACYSAKPAKAPRGTPPFPTFAPTTVTAVDQFSTEDPNDQHKLDLKKPTTLCNPANKNDESPAAPQHAAHLEGYKAKVTRTKPPPPKVKASIHTVVNQIGLLKLKVAGVDRLLVPAAKALGTGGAPPLGETTVDHFTCYKAKVAKAKRGQRAFPTFTATTVTLTDEFGGPVTYDLKRPKHLCAPADKNGEDPEAPTRDGHLVCYPAKQTKLNPKQPKFVRQNVSTQNQFGPEVLGVKSFEELCVPSLKLD